ncbi:MAG: glycosyltransferase, partial [Rhodospirillaceae bacterium]
KTKTLLLLNDCGFRFGAGIATLRQAQSLLHAGHRVALVCGEAMLPHHALSEFPELTPWADRFLGVFGLPMIEEGLPEDARIAAETEGAMRWAALRMRLRPDLIIAGTLHGARWPTHYLLEAADDPATRLLLYPHDLHLLTGRCAHPQSCGFYPDATCSSECPSAQDYPSLSPASRVPAVWAERQALAARPEVLFGANSAWTADQIRLRFGAQVDEARIQDLRLGLDPLTMGPHLPEVARNILGLPAPGTDSRPVILLPATNFDSPFKGASYRRDAVTSLLALPAKPRLLVVGQFGADTDWLTALADVVHKPALHPRMMALAYSAADLVVLVSSAETFGQSAMEAAACATPIAAFVAGGLGEICRPDHTALCVPPGDLAGLCEAAQRLCEDPRLRHRLGRAGRALVDQEFSLEAQAARWSSVLSEV